MVAESRARRIALPSRSKGAQRRRRLARGVARWDLDRKCSGIATRRVARVTLTLVEPEPEAAIGRVYRFLSRVRKEFVDTRYFCWLELQRRGAVHYHMVWLNPPGRRRKDLVAWVQRAWGSGRTQVRFTSERLSVEQAVEYAIEHSKKMGKKSYQQRYDDVPSQLRTFMSQRLEIPPDELDKHLDREIYAYRSANVRLDGDRRGQTTLVSEYLEYVGTLRHEIPPGGRCTAPDHRRPAAARHRRAPPVREKPCRGGDREIGESREAAPVFKRKEAAQLQELEAIAGAQI